MDELKISGKRYISSRRAAKEHGYHSDYIGQLIRGGKVVGQKVGRSWYVEEASLLAYFNEEKTTTTKQAPKEKKEVSVIVEEHTKEEVEKISEQPVEEIVATVSFEEEPSAIEEVTELVAATEEIKNAIFDTPLEEEYVVALKRATPTERKSLLKYVEDDLSFGKKEPELVAAMLEERTADYQDVKVLKEIAPKVSTLQWGRVVFLLAVVGIFTFGITFGISSSLAYSNTLKGTTNTASVIYGL